jgi:hypothetical protein
MSNPTQAVQSPDWERKPLLSGKYKAELKYILYEYDACKVTEESLLSLSLLSSS